MRKKDLMDQRSENDAFLKRIKRRIFLMGMMAIAAAVILGSLGMVLLMKTGSNERVLIDMVNIKEYQYKVSELTGKIATNPSDEFMQDMMTSLDAMSDSLEDARSAADDSVRYYLDALGQSIEDLSGNYNEASRLVTERSYNDAGGLYAQYVSNDEELYGLLKNVLQMDREGAGGMMERPPEIAGIMENMQGMFGGQDTPPDGDEAMPDALEQPGGQPGENENGNGGAEVTGFLYDSMNAIDTAFKSYSQMTIMGASDETQSQGILDSFVTLMNDVNRDMIPNPNRARAYELLQFKYKTLERMVNIDNRIRTLFGSNTEISAQLTWLTESVRNSLEQESAKISAIVVPAMGLTMFIAIIIELIHMNLLAKSLTKSIEMFNELEVVKGANEAKSNLLSNVSHEIRTPINAVLGINEIILRESEDEKIRGYAMDINVAGKTLLSLINDLLDSSRLDAGKIEIIDVEYDFSSCVMDLVNMITVKADDKRLGFEVNVEPEIPHMLYGDEIRIKQCILNILTNAVKYTEEGKVTMNIGYEKADDEHIFLKVQVLDTGIGIKQEDIEKLFKPFERIEEKRNRTIEGTGLGMNIVTKLLAMMDTKLEVHSVYGEGSDFSFRLKQKVVDWEPIGDYAESYQRAKDSAEEYQEKFHAPDARILVVDDTAMNLTVVRGLVKPIGLTVDTAMSGAETLELVCEKEYDMLFIDHMMPVMDGIETLHKMKEMDDNLNKRVPCIALTANAISGAREMYLEAGFDDYISKPIDVVKFEKMLLDYLPKEKIIMQSDEAFAETSADIVNDRREKMELLKSTDGIDYEKGIAACSTPDILLDAVGDFLISIESKPDDIENFWKEGDIRNYTILVHALKSSARLIGAEDLSIRAEYLEKCGNEENIDEINAKTPELLDIYRGYKAKLEAFVDASGDENKEEIDPEQLQEAYVSIAEFVEGFDFDSAQSIIDTVSEYRIPDESLEFFKQVSSLIRTVNRDELLALLMG